jgi:hypothetical protein
MNNCANLFLVLVALVGCSRSVESVPDGRQAQLVENTDGVTRAFVWIPAQSGWLGATISQSYQVWIESEKFSEKRLMVEAAKTDGLRLAWIDNDTLEVCYSDALIFMLLNKFDFVTEQSAEIRSVEVVLRKVKSLGVC